MDPKTVNEIIDQVLSGDVNAFEKLIETFRARVFQITAKRIPPADMDTVSHDVFVEVFKSLSNYQAKSPFENWLARIAVRSCHDYWKKKEREGRLVLSGLDQEPQEWLEALASTSSHEQFTQKLEQDEAVEILDYALNRLDADNRTVLELYYIEQWPMKEISQTLNWSIAKVKIKAMRARHKMRKIIKKMLQDEK